MASSQSTLEAPDLEKMALDIRPATLSDMDRVAEFVRSSADWYRPFVDEKDMSEHDVDDGWKLKNFKRRDFYIGYHRGKPVGTISMQYFGKWVYLGYIYLDVAHVGHGFGHQLMEFAETKARIEGAAGLALIAHPKATWAKRAYLKYGFDIVATKKEDVLRWNNGILKGYYEEGFELYLRAFGH